MKVGGGGGGGGVNKAGKSQQAPLGFSQTFFREQLVCKFTSPPVQESGLMRGQSSFFHLRGARGERLSRSSKPVSVPIGQSHLWGFCFRKPGSGCVKEKRKRARTKGFVTKAAFRLQANRIRMRFPFNLIFFGGGRHAVFSKCPNGVWLCSHWRSLVWRIGSCVTWSDVTDGPNTSVRLELFTLKCICLNAV